MFDFTTFSTNIFRNQVVVPSTDFVLDAPLSGISSGGVLSTIGTLAGAAFTVVLVIWVGISVWAALTIIRGSGDAQAQEKGFTMIKNIWLGISSLFVFFVVLSMIGTIFGFGSVYSWSENFLQCGSGYDGFYFATVETRKSELEDEGDVDQANIYCCPDVFDPLAGSNIAAGWKVVDVNSVIDISYRGNCEFYESIEIN